MKTINDIINEKKTINIKTSVFKSNSPKLFMVVMDNSITKTTDCMFIEDEEDFVNHFSDSFEDAAETFISNTMRLQVGMNTTIDYDWKIYRIK